MTKTFSDHEFEREIGRVKSAADEGPVVITDRGTPTYVLLRHQDYRRLVAVGPSIVDMLAMPGVEEVEFDVPPRRIDPLRQTDFDT